MYTDSEVGGPFGPTRISVAIGPLALFEVDVWPAR
jgi:hypothetical protein